jgi:hypothetical protein
MAIKKEKNIIAGPITAGEAYIDLFTVPKNAVIKFMYFQNKSQALPCEVDLQFVSESGVEMPGPFVTLGQRASNDQSHMQFAGSQFILTPGQKIQARVNNNDSIYYMIGYWQED